MWPVIICAILLVILILIAAYETEGREIGEARKFTLISLLVALVTGYLCADTVFTYKIVTLCPSEQLQRERSFTCTAPVTFNVQDGRTESFASRILILQALPAPAEAQK